MMGGTPGYALVTFGLQNHGFGLITVSRPGYSRTPLTEENKTAEAQADLLVALMDHLGIEKFPVIAASGGGCIAYRLAIQYPDRVQCLLLKCATSGSYDHPEKELINNPSSKIVANSALIARSASWYMQKDRPEFVSGDLMTANKIKPNSVTQ